VAAPLTFICSIALVMAAIELCISSILARASSGLVLIGAFKCVENVWVSGKQKNSKQT
jgi:hypothetical protein